MRNIIKFFLFLFYSISSFSQDVTVEFQSSCFFNDKIILDLMIINESEKKASIELQEFFNYELSDTSGNKLSKINKVRTAMIVCNSTNNYCYKNKIKIKPFETLPIKIYYLYLYYDLNDNEEYNLSINNTGMRYLKKRNVKNSLESIRIKKCEDDIKLP